MAARGVRVGGLGRTLVDVLDRAGADAEAAESPLFALAAPGDVDDLLDDGLTLLGAAFPTCACAVLWQPVDDIAVVRVRGHRAADGAALAVLDRLRAAAAGDDLVAIVPRRDGSLVLAVLAPGAPFTERQADVFDAVTRLVASAGT